MSMPHLFLWLAYASGALVLAVPWACLQVVLVGDPKQLPATLFSRAARELALERSLFERMNNVGATQGGLAS
jgi:superfamily I DNA and/or RNA helicase